MIVNSNHLEPRKRNMLLNSIKYLIDKLVSEKKKMISTLIISSTDSNSEIFRALKIHNPFDFPIKSIEYIKDDYKNIQKLEFNKITLVLSDSSGVGKSRYIRNVHGAYESNLIYFPLGGNLDRKNIYNRLKDSIIKIKEQYLTEDRIVFDYKYNEKNYEIHIFSSKYDVLCKKTIHILNNILLKKEIKKQ